MNDEVKDEKKSFQFSVFSFQTGGMFSLETKN
jgi:hypothetical protein